MDVAYDQIQEEALSPEESDEQRQTTASGGLNTEFQEAFKAVSASPWGAKLGGFFGQVKKQVHTTPTTQLRTSGMIGRGDLTPCVHRASHFTRTRSGSTAMLQRRLRVG